MNINKKTLLTILLILFIILLTIQAVQLTGLARVLKTGSFSKISEEPSVDSEEEQAQLPSSLQNLPGMVGGC